MTNSVLYGALELDVVNQCLWRGDQELALTPKAFGVLRVLVEQSHRLVTKEELLRAVWPGARVEEGQVKQFVSELRKLLQDEARIPRYIATVHGRGYRLVGDIAIRPIAPLPVLNGDAAHAPTTGATTIATIVGPEPACVGRQADLARLEQVFAKARQGRRQVCLVTGEPGIGKTTLIGAFLHRIATRESFVLLRGQCDQHLEEGEPYFPLLDALDNLCDGPEGARIVDYLRLHAPFSLAAMPGHLGPEATPQRRRANEGADQQSRVREYSRFFDALAARQTVVLWLEDLHWADRYTLALLSHLARSPRPSHLLVICSSRPKEMYTNNQALQSLTSDARGNRVGVELQLAALSEETVVDYAQSHLAHEGAGESIYALTEGHPLFMHMMIEHAAAALAGATQDRPPVDADHPIRGQIPDALIEVIEQQLELVSSEHKQLLEAASVAGRQFSAAEAAAALEIEVERAERHCEHLARHHLFLVRVGQCEWPDGTLAGEYRFVHNLCRHTLYQSLPPSQRSRMRQLIGKRIELAYEGSRMASELRLDRVRRDHGDGEFANPSLTPFGEEAAETHRRQ